MWCQPLVMLAAMHYLRCIIMLVMNSFLYLLVMYQIMIKMSIESYTELFGSFTVSLLKTFKMYMISMFSCQFKGEDLHSNSTKKRDILYQGANQS